MGQVKRLAAAVFSVFLIFMFIQSVGGYLIGKLSSFQDTGQVLEQQVEEKVVRQMVLQLEPVEYYTVQVGSYQDASAGQAKINDWHSWAIVSAFLRGRHIVYGWVALERRLRSKICPNLFGKRQ